MNYRVTIGFLVAAVLLFGLVFGLDKFNVGPTPTANSTATAVAGASLQLLNFDDSKVTALELHQADKIARVEKSADAWTVAGTGEPANRISFTSLLSRMSQLRAASRLQNAGDLKQYGLDPPKDSVIAELSDGSRYELQIGDKTPVQTGTYAKLSDSGEVVIIADQFVSDLERLAGDPKEPPTPTPRPVTPTPAAAGPAATDATPTPAP
jgi:hypothetical protein